MKLAKSGSGLRFLGIEGGATRTVALLASGDGRVLQRIEAGPANLKLLTDAALAHHFRGLAVKLPAPDALGIGLAGAWAKSDRERVVTAAAKAWPNVRCSATSDLETAILAAWNPKERRPLPRILVLSGTGSACFGIQKDGTAVKVGGWGHILGDKGSGYEIGLHALRAVIDSYDHRGEWPKLGSKILQATQLQAPNDLIEWAQAADKAQIAGLAVEVFAAWTARDALAAQVVRDAARSLALDGAGCAAKIATRGRPVEFILAGSNLTRQPKFAALVSRELRMRWPGAKATVLRREGVWGAVELAKREFAGHDSTPSVQSPKSKAQRPKDRGRNLGSSEGSEEMVRSSRLSPTEQRNPRSMNLDKLTAAQAVRLMLQEDRQIPVRLLAELKPIEQAVESIVKSFRRGGRLFYVGAGTSGRLGVLDASECPPTFHTDPELVQGLMAGGTGALWQSVEGAEDDAAGGRRAVEFRGVDKMDVVVGIAASGTTPFVWGALAEAKRRRATTVLLCFNPYLQIPRSLQPQIVIAPNLGPELLTGSTRLKAGTATKLVLNILTTVAMVRWGKVMSNLMVDVRASNRKLKQRAVRIVEALSEVAPELAEAALERCGWEIRKAVANLGRRAAG